MTQNEEQTENNKEKEVSQKKRSRERKPFSDIIYRFLTFFAGIDWNTLVSTEGTSRGARRAYAALGGFVILITSIAVAEGGWAGSHFSSNPYVKFGVAILWASYVFLVEYSIMVSMRKHNSFKSFTIRAMFSLSVASGLILLFLLQYFEPEIAQKIAENQENLKVEQRDNYKDVENRFDDRMTALVEQQGQLLGQTPKHILAMKNSINENNAKEKQLQGRINSLVAQRRNIRQKYSSPDSVSDSDQRRINWFTSEIVSKKRELNNVKTSTSELIASLTDAEKRHSDFVESRSKQIKEELGTLHSEKTATIDENRVGRKRLFNAIDSNNKLRAQIVTLGDILFDDEDKAADTFVTIIVILVWLGIQLTPVAIKLSLKEGAYDAKIDADELEMLKKVELERLEMETKLNYKLERWRNFNIDETLEAAVQNELAQAMYQEFNQTVINKMASELKQSAEEAEVRGEQIVKFYENLVKRKNEISGISDKTLRKEAEDTFNDFITLEVDSFNKSMLKKRHKNTNKNFYSNGQNVNGGKAKNNSNTGVP